MDDGGATLATPNALLEEVPLADFAARASRVGRALDAAFAGVPLPPPIAGAAAAWRELAARLGGRFEPGRGAIHDGTLGTERVAITTQWTDGGELRATVVRVPLDARIDLESLSPSARAQARLSIEQSRRAGAWRSRADAVELTFDHALPDPPAGPRTPRSRIWLAARPRRAPARGSNGPFRS